MYLAGGSADNHGKIDQGRLDMLTGLRNMDRTFALSCSMDPHDCISRQAAHTII